MERTATAEEQARRSNTELQRDIQKTTLEQEKQVTASANLSLQQEKTATATTNLAIEQEKTARKTKPQEKMPKGTEPSEETFIKTEPSGKDSAKKDPYLVIFMGILVIAFICLFLSKFFQ